jgi:hypothetical protein
LRVSCDVLANARIPHRQGVWFLPENRALLWRRSGRRRWRQVLLIMLVRLTLWIESVQQFLLVPLEEIANRGQAGDARDRYHVENQLEVLWIEFHVANVMQTLPPAK